MDTNEQHKRRAAAGKLLRVLMFLILASLIYYYGYCYGRPERIREFTGDFRHDGYVSGIFKNGLEYWLTDDANGSVIHARPIAGGQERIIVHEDPKFQIAQSDIHITDQYILYGVINRTQAVRPVSYGVAVPVRAKPETPTTFEGVFRPASLKPSAVPGAHEKRQRLPKSQLGSTFHARWKKVALGGGAIEDIGNVENPYWACVAGDYIYWIRSGPDDVVQVTQSNRVHQEVIGHSDLMAASLKDGSSRKVYSGMKSNSSLIAGMDGVLWTEPHAYPDRALDLYYISAADTRPRIFPSVGSMGGSRGVLTSTVDGVTECKGRVYWFERERQTEVVRGYQVNQQTLRVHSIGIDGSNPRVVLSVPEPHPGMTVGAKVVGGCLYLMLAAPSSQAETTPETLGPLWLYRIDPQKADAAQRIRTVPAGAGDFHFDGDFLYFTLLEEQRDLWASLQDDHTASKVTLGLFRAFLPK